MRHRITQTFALLAAIVMGTAAAAQEDEIYSFIPLGGRGLLEGLQAEELPADFKSAIHSEEGDAEHWQQVLAKASAASPAIAALDSWQTDTLAHYLAVRAPLPRDAQPPRDGRDMALALCQSCHIITVTVTQDRTREAWLGTMNSPSHIEIETTPEERGLLADYLVLNAGIPIDQIPPALRAGGASY
jgi:hypothetical protein